MILKLKKMHLMNFKGAFNEEITFDGSSKVFGCNASGKSTLATAWYWVFCDVDVALTRNPGVTPVELENCVSKVEIELELDGKPLTVAKIQMFKTKEVDGKMTSSVTNSYEVNYIEKSYKAFLEDLKERGIDIETFLIFSHPSAFTADSSKGGREKQREMLFKMCDGVSNESIIDNMDNVTELAGLIDAYKLQEIEQMQKAILKRIKDLVGMNNEVVNARINELTASKSKQDINVLNEQKANYEAEIDRIDQKLMDMTGSKSETRKKLGELYIKLSEIKVSQQNKLNKSKQKYENSIHEYDLIIDEKNFLLTQTNSEINRNAALLEEKKEELKKLRVSYKMEQDAVLDEGDLVCPTCHRTYDKNKLAEIKAEFEKNKAEKLKSIQSKGELLKSEIEDVEDGLNVLGNTKETLEKVIVDTQKLKDKEQAKLDKCPKKVNLDSVKEYVKVKEEIAKLEGELTSDDEKLKTELTSQKNVAKQMLNQIIGEISVLDKNKEIDTRIEELKKQRKQAEIDRASAEKILNQIERFKREKNNVLESEINKHFDGVSFRLFKTLRNGNMEETCDVLIDGKEINTQLNQASQVKARLEIIKGLSNYFGVSLPVFVDDASLLTQNTVKTIKMPNQLIWLCASDDYKELYVKGE